MWVIFWIVNGVVMTVEKLVLFDYLPFAPVLKFGFSVWLVSPIVKNSARNIGPKSAPQSVTQLKLSWAQFSASGCGFLFYAYVKPLFEGKYKLPFTIDVERWSAYGFQMIWWASEFAGNLATASGAEQAAELAGFGAISSKWFSGSAAPDSTISASSKDINDLDDYDVVAAPEAKPVVAEEEKKSTWRIW